MRWMIGIATVAAMAVDATAQGSQQPRLAINLITHAQIEIDRPPSAVWPYIVETNAWKPNRQLTPVSGNKGELGEILSVARGANAGGGVWFLVENVEIVLNERRTIKMYDSGGKLLGY